MNRINSFQAESVSGKEYFSPEIQIIDVEVEKGFASSNEALGEDEGEW